MLGLDSMEATQAQLCHDDELPKGHEIVDGVLVRKATPGPWHGGLQGELFTVLSPYRGRARADRPGGWFMGSEIEIEFESGQTFLPDVAGWRLDRWSPDSNACPVRIAPDWVCEILSISTAHRDRGTKQQTYYRAGVSHYWLLDPLKRALTVLQWEQQGYVVILSAGAHDVARSAPFEQVALNLGELFEQVMGPA